jgi:hypothetical protein
VDQEKSAGDEVLEISARSVEVSKDVQHTSAQIIQGIRVEVAASFWWRDPNEQDADRWRRRDPWRVKDARGALHSDTRQLSTATATPCDLLLEIAPEIVAHHRRP